jgi:hypothetical protein
LCCLRLREALLEFVHAPCCIYELLLTSVERMAGVTNTDDDDWLGGARLNYVSTGTSDFRIHILRVYICFHKRPEKIPLVKPMTSVNFSTRNLTLTVLCLMSSLELCIEQVKHFLVARFFKIVVITSNCVKIWIHDDRAHVVGNLQEPFYSIG